MRTALYVAVLAPVIATAVPGCADEDEGPTVLASGQANPGTIAIDSDHVYWLNRDDQTIVRVPKSGGDVTILARLPGLVSQLALDDRYVYTTTGTALWRAPKTGGIATDVGPLSVVQFGLAVDLESAYWASLSIDPEQLHPAVVSIPTQGGAPAPLALLPQGGVEIALGDDDVYVLTNCYCTQSFGSLYSVPKDGGEPSLVADLGFVPLANAGLVYDGTHLFWHGRGGIVAVDPQRDTEPTVIVLFSTRIFDVDVNHDHIYGVTEESLWVVPKTGGEAESIVTLDYSVYSMAVDDTRLYWIDATDDRIMVTDKPEPGR